MVFPDSTGQDDRSFRPITFCPIQSIDGKGNGEGLGRNDKVPPNQLRGSSQTYVVVLI